jgi:hypothetical protein
VLVADGGGEADTAGEGVDEKVEVTVGRYGVGEGMRTAPTRVGGRRMLDESSPLSRNPPTSIPTLMIVTTTGPRSCRASAARPAPALVCPLTVISQPHPKLSTTDHCHHWMRVAG